MKSFDGKINKLEEQNNRLMNQNIELRGENQQKALDLEVAYDHINRLETKLRHLENPDL